MVRIKHIQGNAFQLGIPLSKCTVGFHSGVRSQSKLPFAPLKSDAPIRAIFGLCRSTTAKLVNGYVVVEDKGTLPIGNYHVTILATDNNGDSLKYKDNFVLGIVGSIAEADYSELSDYDGYFKYPVLSVDEGEQTNIVVTEDAVQLHEGEGFAGEITESAVKMYATYGTSSIEIDEDSVNIIINQ